MSSDTIFVVALVLIILIIASASYISGKHYEKICPSQGKVIEKTYVTRHTSVCTEHIGGTEMPPIHIKVVDQEEDFILTIENNGYRNTIHTDKLTWYSTEIGIDYKAKNTDRVG